MGDADGGGDASSRWQCPYPGCRRSFAELWRLKVHYRAPPDVRGSGRERGHGTELAQCPRCGKQLKPGKHHGGVSDKAAKAAAAAASRSAGASRNGSAGPSTSGADGAPALLPESFGLPEFGGTDGGGGGGAAPAAAGSMPVPVPGLPLLAPDAHLMPPPAPLPPSGNGHGGGGHSGVPQFGAPPQFGMPHHHADHHHHNHNHHHHQQQQQHHHYLQQQPGPPRRPNGVGGSAAPPHGGDLAHHGGVDELASEDLHEFFSDFDDDWISRNSANEKVIAAAAASALAAVAAGDGDAAPEAPLGDGVTNEYGLPQFAAPPASAPPIGAPQLQPLPQLRPSQQQHHHHHHQQQLLPPPSPISAMLLQHGCRPAAQPGTPMLGDCGAGMPPRGMHHGSTASLEGEDLPDIFDGMENWALRVPSPPPPSQLLPAAPAAAAAVAARGGGRLFDFAQFQQPLPPAPAAHAALPAFEEERLGAVWGHDLTYEAKTDGDVMHLLFGAPDCPPEMATIHLHQFTDGPEAGAAIAAQGGGAYGGSSPFPPGSPFDWGGGDLLQQPLLQQQQQQQQQQHRAAAPPPLPGLPLLLPSEPAPFKAEPASGGSSCSAGTALSAAAACESLVASLGMVQADAHARHCAEAGARVPSEPVLYSLVSSCE
ncbi:hypothetical protein Rsub_12307 [Raphidocelis subcapitata]|uniref:Uncharacterized protein n=1 Tax=Raphidocelis subcapitata TaxID=307507 RepID=A0A2V0PIJ9_9CHLO|nr:hypothetical protein Rsub_12307 [Raphidocelis subcapitata]|eukprot:GBF99628.1 hypothetical protein Rsub_12307 [Raphidocelis subcapitata]